MSAWEGSAFQEASEHERERHAREMAVLVEQAPAALRHALHGNIDEFEGTFPEKAYGKLADVANSLGYRIERRITSAKGWEILSFRRLASDVCAWCGKTLAEHGEPYPGRPTPRMPCHGLKAHFASARKEPA